MGAPEEDPQGPVSAATSSAMEPGLLRHGPALGLHVLGLGSAARGLTLEGPVTFGGAWGWKSAEALCFVVGESPAARWGAFGGALLVSVMLGLASVRGPVSMRWVAAVLLGSDLALCLVVGDTANATVHGLAMALLATGLRRRSPAGAGTAVTPS